MSELPPPAEKALTGSEHGGKAIGSAVGDGSRGISRG
jgi:hypothetical protein